MAADLTIGLGYLSVAKYPLEWRKGSCVARILFDFEFDVVFLIHVIAHGCFSEYIYRETHPINQTHHKRAANRTISDGVSILCFIDSSALPKARFA
jgi:hypothetical protein